MEDPPAVQPILPAPAADRRSQVGRKLSDLRNAASRALPLAGADDIAGSIAQIITDLQDLAARLPAINERDAAIASRLATELAGVAIQIRELPDALLAPFEGRWQIDRHPAGLLVFTATYRSQDGRHIRSIVAHSEAELASKLATAETVEPS